MPLHKVIFSLLKLSTTDQERSEKLKNSGFQDNGKNKKKECIKMKKGKLIRLIIEELKEEDYPSDEEIEQVTESESIVACIDINTASREQLKEIRHIDENRVDNLIKLRPYTSVDQLTRISGIGAARLNDIKKQALACVK